MNQFQNAHLNEPAPAANIQRQAEPQAIQVVCIDCCGQIHEV